MPLSEPKELPAESDSGSNHKEEEALALLQAMPDLIFRIGQGGILPMTGSGSAASDGGSALLGTSTGASINDNGHAGSDAVQGGLNGVICEELARHRNDVEEAIKTRKVQTFDLEIRNDGQLYCFETRLAAFGRDEVMALVRDVTLHRQKQKALIASKDELQNHLKDRNAELIRVNEMLRTEVALRGEEEAILKKSFEKLERLLQDAINAMTFIVQKKDPYTAGHQQRVSQLACAIARDMGFSGEQIRVVRIAALLHDLGKIFIPAEILSKPGKLNWSEMSMVKTHPDADYQILKNIDFTGAIGDIVRQHHERMDGSGYPLGLKGNDILIEARIIGVADVVEAMMSNRPYRVAPGQEEALKEIGDNKGILYDPDVVDSCIRLFVEKSFIFELPSVEKASTGF